MAITVVVSLASCTPGDGDGLDANGRPIGEAGTPPPLNPTFGSIQANVFTPSCTVCHAGAGAPLGLRLDAASSYAMLVGIASVQEPGQQRVNPGNPNLSYLINKLEGSASVGAQMPLNAPPLPQSTIDVIRQWISDGALPDMPSGPATDPVRVTSISPLPGSALDDLPTMVMAVFDREVDAATVNDLTFVLERSGGDGSFNDGNEVAIMAASISVPLVNPMAAMFDLAGVPSVVDTYRIRLRGSGASIILDLDGNALDGEFGGTLPSGDGTEGGNFVSMFEVADLLPTLASIQDKIFTPTCATAGCHTGPAGNFLPGGMDLTSVTASFNNLVDVPSLQMPGIMRVAPSEPDNSYLIQKLEGTAGTGTTMPLGRPPLPQASIDVVREWIQQGADW